MIGLDRNTHAERLEIAFDGLEHETARDVLGRVCRREDGASLAELEEPRTPSRRSWIFAGKTGNG